MALILAAEQIARVCHETNRAYCMATGDHSQVPWDGAAGWQRQSSVEGVQALLANPEMTPQDQHATWLATKEKQGWKYGPKKIPEKLEHPCMVPYENLPPKQQAKDHLFQAVVRALAPYTDQPVEQAAPPASADPPPADKAPKKKTRRKKKPKSADDS